MVTPDAVEQLLNAKDRIIEQQEEKITLLEQLAESRRLAFLCQCKELAHHRQFEHSRNHPWGFFWFLLVGNVWPFSRWYRRFE